MFCRGHPPCLPSHRGSPDSPRSHVNFSCRSRDVTTIPKLHQNYSRAGGGPGYSDSTLHGWRRYNWPGLYKSYHAVPTAASSPNSGGAAPPEACKVRHRGALNHSDRMQTWSTPFLEFSIIQGTSQVTFILIAIPGSAPFAWLAPVHTTTPHYAL